MSPGLYPHGCLSEPLSAEDVPCEAEEGKRVQPQLEGVHPSPAPHPATDSLLPCVPEGEGVAPVFPQPGWHGHDHSFAGLAVRVNRHQANFTGVLRTALEGQALGREL